MRSGQYASTALAVLLAVGGTGFAHDIGGGSPVPDFELANMRGGFTTADGLVVRVGVQMDTLVNGTPVLRSILLPDTQSIRVYAKAVTAEGLAGLPKTIVPTMSGTRADTPQQPAPVVSYDVDRANGLSTPRIEQAPSPVAVAVTTSADMADDSTAVTPIAVPAGKSVDTQGGQVRVEQTASGPVVSLDSDTLEVHHLLGATAHVIANTADDRIITSATTVGISLPNATPLNLGSTIFRIEDAALLAARSLAR
jgi:hypothetical protein